MSVLLFAPVSPAADADMWRLQGLHHRYAIHMLQAATACDSAYYPSVIGDVYVINWCAVLCALSPLFPCSVSRVRTVSFLVATAVAARPTPVVVLSVHSNDAVAVDVCIAQP